MIKIYNDINTMPSIGRSVVTVGAFDGIHIAHRAILEEMVRLAKEIRGKSIVITFKTLPKKILYPDYHDKVLITAKEKKKLLQKIGIDILVNIDFTQTFAQTDYAEFITHLTRKMDIHKFVVGFNHYFGKGKEGNSRKLKKLSLLHGFDVEIVLEKKKYGVRVSSSTIRAAISAGDLELASKVLGYNYKAAAHIVSFTEKDIIVKFLSMREIVLPPEGIYEIKVQNIDTLLEIGETILIKKKNIDVIKKKFLYVHFVKQYTKKIDL